MTQRFPWSFPTRPPAATPAPAPNNTPVDMEPQDEPTTCEKCGAPITTGAMAIFCELGKDCVFREEGNAESVDFFRKAWGVDAGKETP